MIVASAALVLAASLSACGGDDDETGGTATSPSEPTATPAAIADRVRSIALPREDMIDGRKVGAPDAAVDVVVFEDFRCPHCLEFTANVEPVLLERYVATGKITLEIRHFPILGDASVVAAVAAQCALRQDAFWPYQKALFLEQAAKGTFSVERFNAIAGELGLDAAPFATCLEKGETLSEVEADFNEARSSGFTGTPSLMVNGETLAGNPDTLDAWLRMLDEALAR